MERIFTIIFILNILFLTEISAQSLNKVFDSTGSVLTLEQCLQIGIDNSKELKISKSKISSAEAKITEANSQLLPLLKFQASYQRLSNIPPFEVSLPIFPNPIQISPVILNNYNLKLTLQQPLFTGFRLWSLKGAAENNYESSNYEYKKKLNDVAFNIQNAFWNYYKAMQIKKVIEENLRLTQNHLDDTKNFMKSGLATRNDILKLEVQYSNTKLQLIESENNIDIARSNLNKLLGLPLVEKTEIDAGDIDTSFTKYNLSGLIEQSKENRSDLKSLEYRVKASDNGITAAKGGWYPSIYLIGDYFYSKPNQRIIPAENKFKDTWDIGVTLQWDLWNWGYTSSKSTEAEEQKTQIETSLSQLKDAVELEVYQTFLTYKRAMDKINVSRQSVEQSEENYRSTQDKYNQQIATSTDLIDAEASLLMAKTNLTTALVDYQLAKVKLMKAIGKRIF
ncbi:MAG: TolC family protein [Ignavibacteriaceae bacterium]